MCSDINTRDYRPGGPGKLRLVGTRDDTSVDLCLWPQCTPGSLLRNTRLGGSQNTPRT